MELRAFAEAVLFSAELASKLHAPETFTDAEPGTAIGVPEGPGRPAGLELVSSRPIPRTPTPTTIEDERIRGQALHTFAHHELQALELMALALLRFPDAPTAFRRGLAKIICDEQRHFRMYQARAEHWGVALGDTGVGHFFWNTVSSIEDPAGFLAALSLTYEQANLDFATYWKSAFEAVDDADTVDVLQAVFEDEIGHVRHGVVWFERFVGRCDFETYSSKLVFPLSPGRGKGPVFNREARVRAGFSPDFIDEIEIRNVSRGRSPRVFSFDPFIEEHIAGRIPGSRAMHIQQDLATVMMFLARKDDVVLARRPQLDTLRPLHRWGFEIPEFAESTEQLGDRVLGKAIPWGRDSHPRLFDKLWALEQRHAFATQHASPIVLDPEGVRCETLDSTSPFLGGDFIAKAPLSASGQHRILLNHPQAATWLKRWLTAGPVLIEPWHTRLLDLSVQLELTDDGVQFVGITRFWTTRTGSYRGAFIGRWTQGLSPELARWIHGGEDKGRVKTLLRKTGEFIGQQAHGLGYRGPLGIDSMLVDTADGPRLQPIVEVNPRTTMGRIALAMGKKSALQGGWFFVTDRELASAGYSRRQDFIEAVKATEGVAFSTDPNHASRLLTVLSLDHTWQKAMDAWTGLGFDPPQPCFR